MKGPNMRSVGGIVFSGPVTLRSGGSRTIAGQTYSPACQYDPTDPGVLAAPQFFILATPKTAPPRPPKPEPLTQADVDRQAIDPTEHQIDP